MRDKTFIGFNADRRRVYLPEHVRRQTHMHVIGGSGTGKSKFLEWLIRQDIRSRRGLCVLDWHGTLCEEVLKWCHQQDVGIYKDDRSIVLIDPSHPDYVTGFNPFASEGKDVSTQVSRRIDATIRPWGMTDTNDMPTLETTCRALFTFMVETKETLPNAAKLLDISEHRLRDYAIATVENPTAKGLWRDIQKQSKNERDWKAQVLSTQNRLTRFLSSTAIRRFMGLRSGNLDLGAAMDEGKIILVNLGYSDFLPVDAARVFASLFINEFFEATMRRATRRSKELRPFTLYMDEFQEYITDDIASMLDQVRKGGLHLVLAHQHLAHFGDNPKLRTSVLTNARIRAVFGGLSYEDACVLGNEMFLPDLNTRQIKKAYYHTIHVYREEEREQRTIGHTRGTSWSKASTMGTGRGSSSSEGTGFGTSSAPLEGSGDPTEGWFTESSGMSDSESEFTSDTETEGGSESESESITIGTVFVPIPKQELGSETEWSREEKLSKVAELLKLQQQRHCYIKIDTIATQPLRVPDVDTPYVSPETLDDYERLVYSEQAALPAAQIDKLLAESEQEFMQRAAAPANSSNARAAQSAGEDVDDDSEFFESSRAKL